MSFWFCSAAACAFVRLSCTVAKSCLAVLMSLFRASTLAELAALAVSTSFCTRATSALILAASLAALAAVCWISAVALSIADFASTTAELCATIASLLTLLAAIADSANFTASSACLRTFGKSAVADLISSATL